MNHHAIFECFPRSEIVGTGRHVFDFLGTRTDVKFKRGWEQFAIPDGRTATPPYPPKNEHYFDWIELLQAVSRAGSVFRMAELGAGWAPWLVRAAYAARYFDNIKSIELLGVEADPTHFYWMREHFVDNDLSPTEHHLIEGAVAAEPGTLKFPRVNNPEEDYGASLRAGQAKGSDTIAVTAHTLESLIDRFTGPIDLIHMDIQGAEYEVVPNTMGLLQERVKTLVIGTHISAELEQALCSQLADGWHPVTSVARNSMASTPYGNIQLGDGFHCWLNKSLT